MKKIFLTLIAAVAMTTSVMAQDSTQVRHEHKQMDPQEMIKHRTDETVKKYELNEEQAKKLLDLNTRFADKMRPMMGGQRRGSFERRPMGDRRPMGERPQMGERRQMGERPQIQGNDSLREMHRQMGERFQAQRMDSLKARRPMGERRGNFGGNREEMQKNMEAYDAELKTILTEEQYNAYKKDEQSRRPRMGMGMGPGRGMRPNGNNENK